MKKQVFNPYLPLYEYIPDGEPHIFNGRLYIYGSHDKFGAFNFCHNDYVTWSTPIDDLKSWKYEGVILKRDEDPYNKRNKHDLFAPDVCKAPDGKYYIYYSYDWSGMIGIAKSDSPVGPFKYYGNVSFKNGDILGARKKDIFQFDPAILIDGERIYLYSGFGMDKFFPFIPRGKKPDGAYVMELDKDMKTIINGPYKILEKRGFADASFKGHEFFEASSIRKIGEKYYFVYSSIKGHELCYATSDSPLGPFKYGGVIISNGDVGLNGRSKEKACYPLGNNHGGLVNITDKWYIFYHRHTNYTNTDRQGLAEQIFIRPDGSIRQVEMTSCSLNGGPLEGKGSYPASICCCLIPKEGNVFYPFFKLPHIAVSKTYITQSGKDDDIKETQYIKNIKDGCLIGYKYFDFTNTNKVVLSLKGKGKGKIGIRYLEEENDEILVDFHNKSKKFFKVEIPINNNTNKAALYFHFKNMKGKLDFHTFELE